MSSLRLILGWGDLGSLIRVEHDGVESAVDIPGFVSLLSLARVYPYTSRDMYAKRTTRASFSDTCSLPKIKDARACPEPDPESLEQDKAGGELATVADRGTLPG